MKPESSGLLEEFEMLERMRQELGEARMQDVTDMNLRNAMITEYKLMAGSSLQLLNMLERYGFIYKLTEDDLARYQRILLQLAQSGCRCQEFVEQCHSIDQEALLASIPKNESRAN
ncbi:hypothetical protein N1030_06680 [Desulfovibrio mangrovi]|uniref:hypothetical protein n=1 Tax=Desulfovibrio mangrovi TaxID=2976983 RepID=UPI002245ED8E|nr:hypothetical protein [Desulfovibrio mangrovi]UZP68651.1 hypothetical protein N1030_06680 [Desulfovibrio mangrovi]